MACVQTHLYHLVPRDLRFLPAWSVDDGETTWKMLNILGLQRGSHISLSVKYGECPYVTDRPLLEVSTGRGPMKHAFTLASGRYLGDSPPSLGMRVAQPLGSRKGLACLPCSLLCQQ